MPAPSLNNPYELGKPDIDVLRDALTFYIRSIHSADIRQSARDILEMIDDSYAIWLDLNE